MFLAFQETLGRDVPNWLAQQTSDPTGGILLQYGAIGVIALIGLWATYFLYKRQERQAEKETERWEKEKEDLRADIKFERDRGDRLEAELLSLHGRISGEFAGKLERATGAMVTITEAVRNNRGLQ